MSLSQRNFLISVVPFAINSRVTFVNGFKFLLETARFAILKIVYSYDFALKPARVSFPHFVRIIPRIIYAYFRIAYYVVRGFQDSSSPPDKLRQRQIKAPLPGWYLLILRASRR